MKVEDFKPGIVYQIEGDIYLIKKMIDDRHYQAYVFTDKKMQLSDYKWAISDWWANDCERIEKL